ncbi:MAG TPA: hypothetical protein VHB79_26595 [Polyangiaceae bacterium]|nr:hypothetical protein [Polyangiaceae bacterium]
MSVRFRWVLSLALAAAVLQTLTPAHAEEDAANRAAARKLAEDGVAALQNGDPATAVQKLEKAHQMLAVPTVTLWSARALVKRGSWVEAAERLREVKRLPVSGEVAVQEQAKRDAEKELADLLPHIPNLVVTVADATPGVTVTLDGVQLPAALLGEERPVNPGQHELVARRGSERQSVSVSVSVSVADGERKPVELRFNAGPASAAAALPAPPATAPTGSDRAAPSSIRGTLAFVALGAGAVGLVVGGVTGLMAVSRNKSLNDNPACNESLNVCTHAVEDDVNSLRTLRTVSTVGFVAGGVLVASGVVLWLTRDPSPTTAARGAHVALGLSPGFVQLRGSFR